MEEFSTNVDLWEKASRLAEHRLAKFKGEA